MAPQKIHEVEYEECFDEPQRPDTETGCFQTVDPEKSRNRQSVAPDQDIEGIVENGIDNHDVEHKRYPQPEEPVPQKCPGAFPVVRPRSEIPRYHEKETERERLNGHVEQRIADTCGEVEIVEQHLTVIPASGCTVGYGEVEEDYQGDEGQPLWVVPDTRPRGDPQQATQHRELQHSIQAAISQLSPSYRSVVILRHVQGLTYQEIVEITGLPMGTVKSRLGRGRARLAELLQGKI